MLTDERLARIAGAGAFGSALGTLVAPGLGTFVGLVGGVALGAWLPDTKKSGNSVPDGLAESGSTRESAFGDHRDARGAVPIRCGQLLPEEVIARGRGHEPDDSRRYYCGECEDCRQYQRHAR